MKDRPHSSGAHFPIPRISEGFIDDVVEKTGGKRTSSIWKAPKGVQNCDYIFPGGIAELKILEQEGLAKLTRQDKLAKIFRSSKSSSDFIDLDFENIPSNLKREVEDILLEPIQGAVRKAAKQLADTRKQLDFRDRSAVLIAVNSGYSSLPPDLFTHLVLRSCRKDTKQIDFLVSLTVHYHQGDFDAYVFFGPKSCAVKAGAIWAEAQNFMDAAATKFNEAMTQMMRDQMNPGLWANHLHPVKDILFDCDGVRYVRAAPFVPDSRLE